MLTNKHDVLTVVDATWPSIVTECRQVLGSEQHYQAMIYHCFRAHGGVPIGQLGMNVRQWIEDPVTPNFQQRDKPKHEAYRGGFETVPDVAFFTSAIQGDWRRRSRLNTLRHIIGAIEIKASERDKARLRPKEIIDDIMKLAAHRQEVSHRGGDMAAIMMVIDTAPDERERMEQTALDQSLAIARSHGVAFCYLSVVDDFVQLT